MTRETFKALLDPLVIALRADFDLPTWTVYFRALEDVPEGLLAAAVERAAKSCTFMPKPWELRTYAEDARKVRLAALVFSPCAQCDETGWQTIEVNGVKRVKRCGCWARHQERLAALGVGHQPLALPAARDWTDVA